MVDYATRRKVHGLPVQLVAVHRLREFLDVFGSEEKIMVILRPVDGGYVFRAEPIYQPRKAYEIKAERSGRRRVFKSVEAALNVARSFGFSSVQVDLADLSPDA